VSGTDCRNDGIQFGDSAVDETFDIHIFEQWSIRTD
jgi:hypothetical protein